MSLCLPFLMNYPKFEWANWDIRFRRPQACFHCCDEGAHARNGQQVLKPLEPFRCQSWRTYWWPPTHKATDRRDPDCCHYTGKVGYHCSKGYRHKLHEPGMIGHYRRNPLSPSPQWVTAHSGEYHSSYHLMNGTNQQLCVLSRLISYFTQLTRHLSWWLLFWSHSAV